MVALLVQSVPPPPDSAADVAQTDSESINSSAVFLESCSSPSGLWCDTVLASWAQLPDTRASGSNNGVVLTLLSGSWLIYSHTFTW